MDKINNPDNLLKFSKKGKKPYKIKKVLPWPPSEGLMQDMEAGLVKSASFSIPIIIKGNSPNNDDVIRQMENRRKL